MTQALPCDDIKKKILINDDEFDLVESFQISLEQENYGCLTAHEGKSTLAHLTHRCTYIPSRVEPKGCPGFPFVIFDSSQGWSRGV